MVDDGTTTCSLDGDGNSLTCESSSPDMEES